MSYLQMYLLNVHVPAATNIYLFSCTYLIHCLLAMANEHMTRCTWIEHTFKT